MYNLITTILGWTASFIYIFAYFQLIRKKWSTDQPTYHSFNFLGGVFLSIHTISHQAWAAAFVNVTWAMIALVGIWNTRKYKVKGSQT